MASVHPQAGGLATSEDGRWVAWSEPTRLILVDTTRRALAAELAVDLEPPVSLAMCADPDRLLVVQTRRTSTRVRVVSIPDLQPIAEGTLDTAARLVAVCGATAVLVAGPDMMTTLDLGGLQSTTLTVRGPIQIVAPFSNEQVLVAARGKLEAWSLEERRPTHRLSLALPKNPGFAGLAAGGTLLWAASADAPGTITGYRLADGTQLGESTAGGTPRAVLGSSGAPTVIAVVQTANGRNELVAIDLLTNQRRVLPYDGTIAAACLAGDSVVILPEAGVPVQVSIAGSHAARPVVDLQAPSAHGAPRGESGSARAPATAAAAPSAEPSSDEPPVAAASSGVVSRLDEWRAQVQTAIAYSSTTTPGKEPAIRVLVDEPRSRTRAELYAWGETVRARRSTAPPPPPQVWRLTELAHRFGLDLRSRALVALLYAAWLDGDGRTGIPVGHIARALGNDEQAWIDALAQGRVGKLGWIRSRFGRTCLHPQVGHYLDEAPPRSKLVTPPPDAPKTLEAPTVPSLWQEQGQANDAFDTRVSALAGACGLPVAVIEVDELPTPRFERALDERLLDARLHGAIALLVSDGLALRDIARLEGAVLLASRGARPPGWETLPVWPPVAEGVAASAS